MTRIGLVVAACSACTFSPPGQGDSPDAAAVSDGPRLGDAQPQVVPCSVDVASVTGTDRGRVGGSGGGANFPPLACDGAAERIVGIALRMSDQDTVFGGRSAHGLSIACATLAIGADGIAKLGPITSKELVGIGESGWTPSTLTPVTSCPDGSVVAGLAAHRGLGNNRFLDARITCARIGHAGTVEATEVLPVAGSLTDAVNDDTVDCNAGEVLVQLPNRTGQGLDSVSLSCALPTCA
jgi:hypothetical protein